MQTKYSLGDIVFDKVIKTWYLVVGIEYDTRYFTDVYKLMCIENGSSLQGTVAIVDQDQSIRLEA